MEKEYIQDFKNKTLIHDGESSSVYRLEDGRILKELKQIILNHITVSNIDYEAKINSSLADDIDEIIKPTSIVYDENRCVGFTSEEVIGKSLKDYEDDLNSKELCDINLYLKLYSKLEQIIRIGNKKGIVFPDICTGGNIIITPNDEIKLIDFDGLQLGPKDKSISISTSLGYPDKYLNSSKYSKFFLHFTPEVDKASLTVLFYLLLFRVNIANVGKSVGFGKPLTYEEIFKYINLKDQNLINKSITNLSNRGTGSFLETDLIRLAKKFILIPNEYLFEKEYFTKRLMPKR